MNNKQETIKFNNNERVYLKEDNNVSQIVDDNNKDWSLWERLNRQETVEEAAERLFTPSYTNYKVRRQGFIEGAKWAAENLYTEEDMRECWKAAYEESFNKWVKQKPKTTFKKWFNKYKKK